MVERRVLVKPERMEIDKSAELWIKKIAHANQWRMPSYITAEDLVQEGYVDWYRTVTGKNRKGERQPGEPVSAAHKYQYITSRKHIMSLFQSTCLHHIVNLSNQRTKDSPFNVEFDDGMDAPDDELATAYCLARQAPEPVRKALVLYASGDPRLSEPYEKRPDGTRETLNDRLCRLTGFVGDIVGTIKQHFGDIGTGPGEGKDDANPGGSSPLPRSTTLDDIYIQLRKQGKHPVVAQAHAALATLAVRIQDKRGPSLRTAKKPAREALTCGRWLIEAKALCKQIGVSFVHWVNENCGFTDRTARRYMWLCRKAGRETKRVVSMSIATARRFLMTCGMSLSDNGETACQTSSLPVDTISKVRGEANTITKSVVRPNEALYSY